MWLQYGIYYGGFYFLYKYISATAERENSEEGDAGCCIWLLYKHFKKAETLTGLLHTLGKNYRLKSLSCLLITDWFLVDCWRQKVMFYICLCQWWLKKVNNLLNNLIFFHRKVKSLSVMSVLNTSIRSD